MTTTVKVGGVEHKIEVFLGSHDYHSSVTLNGVTIVYPSKTAQRPEAIAEYLADALRAAPQPQQPEQAVKREFEVGMKVRRLDCNRPGVIIAIHKDHAWVELESGATELRRLCDLSPWSSTSQPKQPKEQDVQKEFNVGDKVRYSNGWICTVLAVDGDEVWAKVDGSSGGRHTFHTANVSHLPSAPTPSQLAAKEIVTGLGIGGPTWQCKVDNAADIIDRHFPDHEKMRAVVEAAKAWRDNMTHGRDPSDEGYSIAREQDEDSLCRALDALNPGGGA